MKILILGVSSYVGRHLWARQGADRAIATYNSSPVEGGVRFDVRSQKLPEVVSDLDGIGQAIILLGDTQPDSCFADPSKSRALNVEATKRLIDDLRELGIKPVFTSSEFVFDGAKGGYSENDVAEPILLYGAQKLEVEKYIEQTCEDYAILRLAKVYGSTPGDGTLLTGMFDAVLNSTSIRCADDQRFSAVYVEDVVGACIAACSENLQGTFHVGGPASLTRLGYLECVISAAKRFRNVDVEIETCSILDFDLPEKRPVDVSMNSGKLYQATGLTFLDPKSACDRISEQLFAVETRRT